MFSVLSIAGLLFLVGCTSLRLRERRLTGSDGWDTDGASPRRQYAVAELLNPPLTEVWSYNATAAFGPGSPLLSSGIVTVGTRKGELHMVDVLTGKRIGMRGFGDAIEAPPVLFGGVAYVPVAWGKGGLYAYDLYNGKVLWRRREGHVESGLLHTGSHLLAVESANVVSAVEPRTGETAWQRELDERSVVLAAPVSLGGQRFAVVDVAGTVTALNAEDGTVAWSRSAGAPVRSTPASVGGTLYLGTTRGRLVALDAATGTPRWESAIPDTTVYLTSPAATERDVIVGGSDGVVRSFDARDGALQWSFEVGEAVLAAPLITAEAVYVAGLDGKLYGLDRATGTPLWEHELEGRVKSAMAAHEGYLVVLSEPRTVYLFKKAGDSYAASK